MTHNAALSWLQRLPQPPRWFVAEAQQKMVLLLNHVLQQEPAAMERLKRQAGRVVRVEWPSFVHWELTCAITKAGLLDVAAPHAEPDLRIVLNQASPWGLAQNVLNNTLPPLHIAGDVQLAADINWLLQHVRWDIAEDLERILGPALAAPLCKGFAQSSQALRRFVAAQRGRAA